MYLFILSEFVHDFMTSSVVFTLAGGLADADLNTEDEGSGAEELERLCDGTLGGAWL